MDIDVKFYFRHEWNFDWPWEMVRLKDWFFMINTGHVDYTIYLHVRVLGIHSLWRGDWIVGNIRGVSK